MSGQWKRTVHGELTTPDPRYEGVTDEALMAEKKRTLRLTLQAERLYRKIQREHARVYAELRRRNDTQMETPE